MGSTGYELEDFYYLDITGCLNPLVEIVNRNSVAE